jgi:hypothetical protein
MGGCFSGEVARVEFLKGRADVIGVEYDVPRQPVVIVDLDHVDYLVVGPIGHGEGVASQDVALATRRNGGRRDVQDPHIGDELHIRDFGIPAASDPGVDDPPSVVSREVVGEDLGHGTPVASPKMRHVALQPAVRLVLQAPLMRVEFIEAGQRLNEV